MPKKSHAEQIAQREYLRVKKAAGKCWAHYDSEMRQGLVYARILLVVLGQDESIAPTHVLRYAHELTQAAAALLDADAGKIPCKHP